MTFLSFAGAQTEAWFLGSQGVREPCDQTGRGWNQEFCFQSVRWSLTEQPGICTSAGGSITKAVFAVILVYLYIHFFYFKGVQGRGVGGCK